MSGIPRNQQLQLNEREVAPRRGTYAATVTDRGQTYFMIVTAATLDIRRAVGGRTVDPAISVHTN
jgi:hypothetical protein